MVAMKTTVSALWISAPSRDVVPVGARRVAQRQALGAGVAHSAAPMAGSSRPRRRSMRSRRLSVARDPPATRPAREPDALRYLVQHERCAGQSSPP